MSDVISACPSACAALKMPPQKNLPIEIAAAIISSAITAAIIRFRMASVAEGEQLVLQLVLDASKLGFRGAALFLAVGLYLHNLVER